MQKNFVFKGMLLALFMGLGTLFGWAQEDSKLSVTTQMFLEELKGEVSFTRDIRAERNMGLIPIEESLQWGNRNKIDNRIYATPDTINGKVYIAAFLRLANPDNRTNLETLGVVFQEEFSNGLFTSLIPVDKINEVAAVSNVKRINVSPLQKLMTNSARQYTNVDAVLSFSTDAISSGLKQKYDGTGVVLGIIDTGIDFNHIAFKDANGNSRIKQAYIYNGTSATEYNSIPNSSLTDDKTYDHGTHTSSTAGGSSVIVKGNDVVVTNDHANATYGGMAPGSDLYLAGISGLSSTYLVNAVNKMCSYADSQGKPLVVSNSWGSQAGPHDGTGDVADVYNSLFGKNHPNRVVLFAASNDGGKSKDDEGGGYHVSKLASSGDPLRSILRSATYVNTDGGYFYNGIVANVWCRSTSVSGITCKVYVLDSKTGEVLASQSVSPSTGVFGSKSVSFSEYYNGSLIFYKDYISSNKTQILVRSTGFTTKNKTTTTKNGKTYYVSPYTLAVEFAPSSGAAVIDAWGGNYCYFTNHLTTSGYAWTAGTDDGCYSDEATIDNVIPIGAYVSKTDWTDYNGTSRSMADVYTMGDIAYFSSWGTTTNNPAGKMIPWITAPGARLAAGVNHNHTSEVDGNSYYGNSDLVVNNSSYPYAMMEGTSMATPTAAGIVALWMQAAQEVGKQPTVDDIKEVMKESSIKDYYTTTGPNASHFGNGKIDALKGIKYILGIPDGPTIATTQQQVDFQGYATMEYTENVTVTGRTLEGDITVSILGDESFSVDKQLITQTDGVASENLAITYSPTVAGKHMATITLSSTNAEDVIINLSGTADSAVPTIITDKQTLTFEAVRGTSSEAQTVNVSGIFLDEDVTVNVSGSGFAVADTSILPSLLPSPLAVTFTAPAEKGEYIGTITLSSPGAEDVVIEMKGTSLPILTTMDVYQLTGSLSAGEEYLIVSSNSAGSCYALGHSGSSVVSDAVNVNAADEKSSLPYILPEDVDNTSRWAAANGWTFKNENYYMASSGIFNRSLVITTSSTNWAWNSGSNNMYYDGFLSDYYLVYNNSSGFSLSTSAASIYLYKKTSITIEEEYVSPMIVGDINRDGQISIADVTALVNMILGKITQENDSDQYDFDAADVNGDGQISIADVTALVNIILGK